MNETRTRRRLPTRTAQLRWAGPLVVALSVVANGLLFLVADAVGFFPAGVVDPGSGQPFSLVTVAMASVVGAAGATVVYAIFDRFLARADKWFRIVTVVVLLGSVVTPFSVPGAPASTIASLLAMHVVVAVVAVTVLTTRDVN